MAAEGEAGTADWTMASTVAEVAAGKTWRRIVKPRALDRTLVAAQAVLKYRAESCLFTETEGDDYDDALTDVLVAIKQATSDAGPRQQPSFKDIAAYWVNTGRSLLADVASGRYVMPLRDARRLSTSPRGVTSAFDRGGDKDKTV